MGKRIVGLLIFCLCCACRPAGTGDDERKAPGVSRTLASFRKACYRDIRYRLFFSIPEEKGKPVEGEVAVSFSLDKKEPVILDFRGMPGQIVSVELNGEMVPYEFCSEHIVFPANRVQPGGNTVRIGFTASDQSLNRREEFLYTLLVPDRARTLFPCFDQPDMKALYTLTLEVPAEWEAVANGRIIQTDATPGTGRKRVSFAETEPLSTYLFSFVAGKLRRETYRRGEREISLYHRETDPKKIAQCPEIARQVWEALAWLEDYTGIPYPFAKYDLIILPGFQYGGMEHTGATLYTDRRMFLNEHPTLDEALSRSALIAHETAHMWFGDYVTMAWFDDVWTKEVFANYFASQIVEPLFPQVNHRLNFMCDYFPPAYAEDRTAGSVPVKQTLDNLNQAGLVYGNIVYDKSPVVLEMLVRRMGKEAFREGIREYLKTYAYGNATWEGLIGILDGYTDEDLTAWSRVWVDRKGMPEIMAVVRNDSLAVVQHDPWERGVCWPQELVYKVISGAGTETVRISLDGENPGVSCKLKVRPEGAITVLSNTDGRGYGFFRVSEADLSGLSVVLGSSSDGVLRGSLLITLYENVCRGTISPDAYWAVLSDYLPEESDPLLFSLALGQLGNCERWHPSPDDRTERLLWELVSRASSPAYRLQAFRLLVSTASSTASVERLYKIWKERCAPEGCALSENDYTRLSYQLAVRLPERADEIVAVQYGRLDNPDRKREYAFIASAVSPRQTERDSVFASLLHAENRRIEPWASSALAYLNHPYRQQEAARYIRPALEILPEVQRTGDIFFPTAWLRSLLAGHTSERAYREVDRFLDENEDLPPMLSAKIRQQADHLVRLFPEEKAPF